MGQQVQPPLPYGSWLHDRQTPGPAPGAAHLVLRIRLPDRPGALGAVASRIGAVGADIVDVIVARSSGGSALDEFHVDVPTTRVDVVALLTDELAEVDGAHLESWFAGDCCQDRAV
jgi:ACT domain-containing protein